MYMRISEFRQKLHFLNFNFLQLYDFAKPLGKKFIDDLKYKVFNMEVNVRNYEDCMDKIKEMIKIWDTNFKEIHNIDIKLTGYYNHLNVKIIIN